MNRIEKLDLQWQALRFAVDQIDIAWSVTYCTHGEIYGELFMAKRDEMNAHRDVLNAMQDEVLNKKRAYESLEK